MLSKSTTLNLHTVKGKKDKQKQIIALKVSNISNDSTRTLADVVRFLKFGKIHKLTPWF